MWRQQLDPSLILAYPLVRPITTLMTVEDRLVAVGNWLGTLHDDRPDERKQGVAVANLAVAFAFKLLGHLGLEDTDGPDPPITNLQMAQLAIANLLAVARAHLVETRNFAALQDRDVEEMLADASAQSGGLETAAAPTPSGKLEIDPNTFTVWYKGKSCELGNTVSFHLLVRLNQSPTTAISYQTLADEVWGDEHTETAAIHKQASILGKKLRAAGLEGVKIDGSLKGHYRLILR
jgi:hypothetical protein